MKHLISIDQLGRNGIERILDRAASFGSVASREVQKVPALRGRLVVNLFYESSTRTTSSFELAAKRLSADVISIRSSGSSVDKGESLKDTITTLDAYEPAAIVVRHPRAGAADLVARWTRAAVINAGDGAHAHPTQALLDVHTLRQRFGQLDGLKIWIVGDIAHSRVARSTAAAFGLMGASVTLCGPPTLLPPGIGAALGCRVVTNLDELAEADVVYTLRMQHERMQGGDVPSLNEYAALYGITGDRLVASQVVMHPGPVNRGVELAGDVVDSAQSLIGEQVAAGVAVRMAVLYELLAGAEKDERVREAATA
ncbi:MAG: aspartate carbamoyltransferase catalytic subunit [Actinomycetes bacterium]